MMAVLTSEQFANLIIYRNLNLKKKKKSLVAVLQQRYIFMPTKIGSGKSKFPGHLRLCDKNILILNIFL